MAKLLFSWYQNNSRRFCNLCNCLLFQVAFNCNLLYFLVIKTITMGRSMSPKRRRSKSRERERDRDRRRRRSRSRERRDDRRDGRRLIFQISFFFKVNNISKLKFLWYTDENYLHFHRDRHRRSWSRSRSPDDKKHREPAQRKQISGK